MGQCRPDFQELGVLVMSSAAKSSELEVLVISPGENRRIRGACHVPSAKISELGVLVIHVSCFKTWDFFVRFGAGGRDTHAPSGGDPPTPDPAPEWLKHL